MMSSCDASVLICTMRVPFRAAAANGQSGIPMTTSSSHRAADAVGVLSCPCFVESFARDEVTSDDLKSDSFLFSADEADEGKGDDDEAL